MATVTFDKPRPHIGVIRLNRPERRNAMSIDLCLALRDALEKAGEDNDCWVVILTGAGSAFCSGLDLKDHSMIPNIDGLTVPRIGPRAIRIYSQVIPIMRNIPQPIIAAINGPAYGGGMCLTLAADLRIAAESAFITTAFANIGLSGDYGSSFFLTQLVGSAKARELFFTADRVDASECERLGIVNRVVPGDALEEETLALAHRLASGPPLAHAHMKRNLDRALRENLHACLAGEAEAMVQSAQTEDHREAVRAFLEKRPPVFRGH